MQEAPGCKLPQADLACASLHVRLRSQHTAHMPAPAGRAARTLRALGPQGSESQQGPYSIVPVLPLDVCGRGVIPRCVTPALATSTAEACHVEMLQLLWMMVQLRPVTWRCYSCSGCRYRWGLTSGDVAAALDASTFKAWHLELLHLPWMPVEQVPNPVASDSTTARGTVRCIIHRVFGCRLCALHLFHRCLGGSSPREAPGIHAARRMHLTQMSETIQSGAVVQAQPSGLPACC